MLIKVRVEPSAKKEVFEIVDVDTFRIAVKQKPERNQANLRVRELLALHLGIPVRQVTILTGHHGRNKICSVPDSVSLSS